MCLKLFVGLGANNFCRKLFIVFCIGQLLSLLVCITAVTSVILQDLHIPTGLLTKCYFIYIFC